MTRLATFGVRSFSLSAVTFAQKQSQVLWKLNRFIETGEIKRLSDTQVARKAQKKKEQSVREFKHNGISPQKALLLLRLKYDAIPLQTKDGESINLHNIKPSSLTMTGDMLAKVYDALMEVKRASRRKPDDSILLVLLGALPTLVKDPFYVTKDVLKLLELDQNPNRALELCRIAKKNGSVGMNAILQWSLEKGDVKLANKVMVNRIKWGIPTTDHSHVIYFSGLADMHEWGLVPSEIVEKVVESISSGKIPKKVEIYNAALKVLVKDYSEYQRNAWLFFDKYVENGVQPDGHTFTIFLNGCKKFYAAKAEKVRDDRNLSAKERTTKLYELQAQIVLIAETVLLKLLEAAKPPVPPTKEQAQENPDLLKQYRTASYLFKNEVDRVFASTFLSCFTADAFGTGVSSKQGPNYAYLQRVLFYLQAWVPETRDLAQYAVKGDLSMYNEKNANNTNTETVIERFLPQKSIEMRTISREDAAEVPKKFRPENVLQELTLEDVNPNVVFPPSPYSKNKSAATYSNKMKPLVDFSRVHISIHRKEYERRLYVKTKGKEGVNHAAQNIDRDPNHINKFLLRIYLESLIKMGLYKEFHLAVWYSLNKWGGVAVDLEKVYQNGEMPYNYSREHVLAPDTGSALKFIQSNAGAEGTSKNASSAVIDIGLVEDFMFKIEEHFPRAANSAYYALELLAATCYGSPNTLEVRAKTFDAIFSILNRDLYNYNDMNKEKFQAVNVKRGLADNTPKKSLTFKQLLDLTDNISILSKCILAWKNIQRSTGKHIESLDNLLSRIYAFTWIDAPETHDNRYKVHERLIYSSVFFWRPRHLSSPREDDHFVKSINESVEYVYAQIKDRSDLNAREKKLKLLLQDIFKLESSNSGVEERLRALQWKIYRLGERLHKAPSAV